MKKFYNFMLAWCFIVSIANIILSFITIISVHVFDTQIYEYDSHRVYYSYVVIILIISLGLFPILNIIFAIICSFRKKYREFALKMIICLAAFFVSYFFLAYFSRELVEWIIAV